MRCPRCPRGQLWFLQVTRRLSLDTALLLEELRLGPWHLLIQAQESSTIPSFLKASALSSLKPCSLAQPSAISWTKGTEKWSLPPLENHDSPVCWSPGPRVGGGKSSVLGKTSLRKRQGGAPMRMVCHREGFPIDPHPFSTFFGCPMGVPRPGIRCEMQLQSIAIVVTYAIAHSCSNTGSSTDRAGLRVKLVSQCSRDTANPIAPQQELSP